MDGLSYQRSKERLETYFDRVATEAWARLTSDGPVSRIRATVRLGRDEMRSTLLSWLPDDLHDARILDAGCGTGALAVEAAERGASVVAIDHSQNLIGHAQQRLPATVDGRVEFAVGDMMDPSLGDFDFVIAMDSLIHYHPHDVVQMTELLARRARSGVYFTFAPRTPLLTLMHLVGRLFPRSDRAPAIQPVRARRLRRRLQERGLRPARTHRVNSGFYTSQALEVVTR